MSTTTQGQSVQRTHIARVLQVLGASGAMSRDEIAKRVRVSRSTLSEIVSILLDQGAIAVADTDAGRRTGRGRPAEMLALDPAAGQFMGVDFGRSRVHIAVADAAHSIIASGGEPYPPDATWAERMATGFDLVARLGEVTGTHYGALRGVGVGFPGPLSPYTPRKEVAQKNGAEQSDADVVRDAFTERFGASVVIDNNTRFAALAEASWGRQRHTEHLLYLRLAGGVGGGVIIGGRLVSGSAGFAGELGHVSIDGRMDLCHCGKRGCLETVASLPALLAHCRAAGADVLSLDDVRDAVRKEDPIVLNVLRDAASAIGKVLGTAAVMFNPAEIVLAGDIVDAAPIVLQHVSSVVSYELLPMLETPPTIRETRLGDDAGALGALVAVFHHSPLLADYPEPAVTR